MFARRHTGISLILPRQDKHMGGWLQIKANQASLESARQVGRVGSALLDSNEVPTRRCCVCTAGLKPPELRCSHNFNPHFFFFLLATPCSPLLCSRHRINRANFSGQTKDRRRASLTPKQTSLKSQAAAEVFTLLRWSPSSAHRRFTNT